MDWPVTQNYVKAVAEYLRIPLRVFWRVNGFWGEVYRLGASWPVQHMDPDTGRIHECRQSTKQVRSAQLWEKILDDLEQAELESLGHRMKFPSKSGSLATRLCSSILKIMETDREQGYPSNLSYSRLTDYKPAKGYEVIYFQFRPSCFDMIIPLLTLLQYFSNLCLRIISVFSYCPYTCPVIQITSSLMSFCFSFYKTHILSIDKNSKIQYSGIQKRRSRP